MELQVDASEAGLDAGCLPLDECLEDGLSLGMFELEKACSSMLGNEVEGLQDSESHLFLWQVWELLFKFTECLGIGFGLGVELVVVTVFACTVLPDAIGHGLELMNIRGEIVSFVCYAHQWCTSPTA